MKKKEIRLKEASRSIGVQLHSIAITFYQLQHQAWIGEPWCPWQSGSDCAVSLPAGIKSLFNVNLIYDILDVLILHKDHKPLALTLLSQEIKKQKKYMFFQNQLTYEYHLWI